MSNMTDEAFEKYLRDPVVQRALSELKGTLGIDLLRDCFMAGAKYVAERCKALGHSSAGAKPQ